MSWTDVKYVLSMEPRWKDALQFAVLIEIAKRYNPTFGYAWPSLTTIGKRYHRSARRVNEMTVELENRCLVIRLGPDPDALGSRHGTQRFVPMWRVENGVQQLLREAVEADDAATRGAQPVEHSAETDATSRMGACDISHGGHANPRMPGMRNLACDQGTFFGTSEVPQGTDPAAAAAQPRLPTLLAEIRHTLVAEILRKRHGHLASDPAKDDNWKQLLKAACDVLANPELGARLVHAYTPTQWLDQREAVRLLCDKRHVYWGKPSYDRLRDAIAAAEVLLKLRSGQLDARPRDAAAAAQERERQARVRRALR